MKKISCTICNQRKPEEEYYTRQKTKCKNCFNELRKQKRKCICRHCKQEYKPQGKGSGRFCSLKCRFMSKVEITKTCWIWKAGKNINQWGKQYGTIQMGPDNKLAHRVSYELFKKKIPEGKIICHICDVELCVNPRHLWIGTYEDNMQDMKIKGRSNYYRGEQCPSAKLTENDVENIKHLRSGGMMIKDIAFTYEVHPKTIQNILSGKSWREE